MFKTQNDWTEKSSLFSFMQAARSIHSVTLMPFKINDLNENNFVCISQIFYSTGIIRVKITEENLRALLSCL